MPSGAVRVRYKGSTPTDEVLEQTSRTVLFSSNGLDEATTAFDINPLASLACGGSFVLALEAPVIVGPAAFVTILDTQVGTLHCTVILCLVCCCASNFEAQQDVRTRGGIPSWRASVESIGQ